MPNMNCECELRDRAWTGTGLCQTCGSRYDGGLEMAQTVSLTHRWNMMQEEVVKWANTNFKDTQVWQLFLGVCEEVGEFSESMNELNYAKLAVTQEKEKANSIARKVRFAPEMFNICMEDLYARSRSWRRKAIDALGDQAIYVLNLCDSTMIKLGNVTNHNEEDFTFRTMEIHIGKASHYILKHSQGIRNVTRENRNLELIKFINYWYVWATKKAQLVTEIENPHEALYKCTNETWKEVKKRDWVKHPTDAPSHQ